ncbi:Sulfhydryl oxidase 1 [Chamberlinius hualienensis]
MRTVYVSRLCLSLILAIGFLPIWHTNAGIFSKDALYTPEDDVTLVNVTTFHSIINGRQNAWLFQFFNQWCGHCVQFSKTYIQLASIVKPWSPVITVAALDCADTANLEICRNFSVTAFPTLKFFPTNMNEDDRGYLYTGIRSVEEIKQSMIKFVSTDDARPNPAWPSLSSIKNLNEDNMWDASPKDSKNVAILLESEDSYIGREIILGTLPLRKYITVLRGDIVTSNFKNVESIEGPVLIIAKRGGKLQTYIDTDNAVSGYIQFLEDHVQTLSMDSENKRKEMDAPGDGRPKSSSSQNAIGIPNKDLQIDLNQAYLRDVENVIRYIYWHEVALHQVIKGSQLSALKSFTSVLAEYLPANPKMKQLLCHLNVWLDEQNKEITSAQLQNKLKELQVKYDYELTMKSWMGCRGSQTFFRGYPCGLWTTFHILTANHYMISGKDKHFKPTKVLTAIRGYVMNFFSCERCVRHFTKMSANLESEVNSPDSAVLWLWQAHNKVNARLKGDETEDPFHPKQQYPTEIMCSSCRQYTDDTNFQWNLNEVLDFLLDHYSEKTVMETADIENDDKDTPIAVLNNSELKHKEWKRESLVIQEFRGSVDEYKILSLTFPSQWGLGKADTVFLSEQKTLDLLKYTILLKITWAN